ncbi:serpentine type 7TM GPCR chemoreceptor srt domain-containing protein [Ditylenchus destructor]|nr:serpentine type 7TM GPCR chemoreceptor srt domain-containing protein [Ditylenchus destructor]
MSVCDCSILWILGFFHGYMAIEGAVFCSHPTLIFFTGVAVTTLWIFESSAEVILSLNRCVAMLSAKTEETMFGGWRVNIWIFVTLFHGLLWGFFIHPVLFNGIHFTWFFCPYVGYNDSVCEEYNTVLHVIWDGGVMAFGVPVGYIIFFIVFILKRRKLIVLSKKKKLASSEKMMFIQTMVISILNFFTGSVYAYMMYFETSELLIHIAQWSWFHIHGFPPVVFLLLNKTIRNDTKMMLYRLLGHHPKLHKLRNMFSISPTIVSNTLHARNTMSTSEKK